MATLGKKMFIFLFRLYFNISDLRQGTQDTHQTTPQRTRIYYVIPALLCEIHWQWQIGNLFSLNWSHCNNSTFCQKKPQHRPTDRLKKKLHKIEIINILMTIRNRSMTYVTPVVPLRSILFKSYSKKHKSYHTNRPTTKRRANKIGNIFLCEVVKSGALWIIYSTKGWKERQTFILSSFVHQF